MLNLFALLCIVCIIYNNFQCLVIIKIEVLYQMFKQALTSWLNNINMLSIILVFATPYFMEYWWKFLAATIIILIIGKINLYGIKTSKQQITLVLCIAVVFFVIFRVIVLENIRYYGINYRLHDYSEIWVFTIFFQVLNEEMILRSLLLQLMRRKIQSTILLSAALAILFSLCHYLFYYLQGDQLNFYALIFIFLFGMLSNILFIKFKHIWFGFAIHFAWNATRFTGCFLKNGVVLSEGASFNYIEGNTHNLILDIIMTVALLLILRSHFKKLYVKIPF